MPYKPQGIEFYDQATEQRMMLVTGGPSVGWLVRKHKHTDDWVTVREATDDRRRLCDVLGITPALLEIAS